ncbi:unnamed protein product [Chondrus crispus]|uniref:Uncharacterized protein n=1 Tax=Chondrus crispus TaxID=2769 RepID=R7QKI7_CHOCR|nr:unnamed protein product [Chondrus crispus]CDF38589.1 unnamed protein product [Chondrus crispus]|eukprot:XP_005718494.1 unnamed protein product [Chondrus crispus]
MKLSMQIKEKLKSSSHPSPISDTPPPTPTAPPTIEAARVSQMDLDRECILERSRLVSIAPARMPYIGFHGKYNKRWYVDIVSLPHNSVRTLISEVFGLLTSVHRLALDMTRADFDNLFLFLAEFQAYTAALLAAEDRLVYPEVEAALRKRPDYAAHVLHPTHRAERKNDIARLLAALTDPTLHYLQAVAVANTLQATVDELSRQLLDYFSAQEAVLPRIFAHSMRGSREKNKMEAKLIKYFADAGHEFYYTALLALPLHSQEVRADFEERHFAKPARAHQFRTAVKRVQDSLIAIPRAFDAAASDYETKFSMAAFLENYGKDRDVDATTTMI